MSTITTDLSSKTRTPRTKGNPLADGSLTTADRLRSQPLPDDVACNAFLRKIAEIRRKLGVCRR